MSELGSQPAFFRVFEGLPRQGPGSDDITRRIAATLKGRLPARPRMADMGCGNGRAAVILAKELRGRVTAIDLHQPFLDDLTARAAALGVADAIEARRADMMAPGIAAESLDLVWSEGAAFAVGFDAALSAWADLLTPGGVLVVSENSWLTAVPCEGAKAFWNDAYPDMRTVGENLVAAENLGFTFLDVAVLPPAAWEDEYYGPLEARCTELAGVAAADPHLKAVIAGVRAEIDTFRRCGHSYGYVFYVLRKPA